MNAKVPITNEINKRQKTHIKKGSEKQ